jgi:AraC-like DNA-binding protein
MNSRSLILTVTNLKNIIILIVLIFIFPAAALSDGNIGLPGCPYVRNFSPKNYKAHPQNWSIVQDNSGIMYFGNDDGCLIEFDGSHWRRIETGNNSVVRSLAVDADGTVYIGSARNFGFLKTDDKGGKYFVSLLDRLKKEERNFPAVWNIHITSHGIYFNARTYMFRWHNNKMEVFPMQAVHRSFAVYDRVFIQQEGGGIAVFEKGIPGFTTILNSKFKQAQSGRILISPYNDAQQTIMIATEKKGFFLYDLTGPSVFRRFSTEIDDFLKQNTVYSTVKLSNHCFAYGTRKGGIGFIDGNGKRLKIIDETFGLRENSVWALYVDRDRNLWTVGNNGISYIEVSSPVTRFNKSSGLTGMVLAVVKFQEDIYVGTFDGIFHLGRSKLHFRPVSNYKKECWNFLQVNDSLLAAGKSVLKVVGNTAVRLTDELPCYCLAQSKMIPGIVFFGWDRGIGYLETNSPKPFVYRKIKGIDGSVRKIVAGDNYDLWLTVRYKGIIHLKFIDKDLAHPEITRYGIPHGLPEMKENWIHRIDDEFFAATLQGIYKIVPGADGRFRFVPETTFGKKFTRTKVYQFYKDPDKTYWVNSGSCFGRLSRQGTDGEYSWHPVSFSNNYDIFETFFVQKDGVIWLASSVEGGLIRYDPRMEENYKRNCDARIRKVTAEHRAGRRVLFYGDRHPGAGGIVPVLDFRENTLLFEFAAVSYENPYSTRFKYMLEGFEEQWSEWTANASKEYNKLPFGEYCFKVKALIASQHESSESSYRFRISPPWYHSTAAYICYTILAMVLVVFLIKFHFYRVRQAIALEKKKYKVSPDLMDQHLKKLLQIMETEKPYLDPGLKIEKLAEMMFIPTYQVSQLLNTKLNRKFFDFINQYRINEAKRILSGPEGKVKSIMQIAYDVGFNSKSSFNTAFRKFAGTSPSKFKKSTKKSSTF